MEKYIERIENLYEFEAKIDSLQYLVSNLKVQRKNNNPNIIEITSQIIRIVKEIKDFEFVISVRKVNII